MIFIIITIIILIITIISIIIFTITVGIERREALEGRADEHPEERHKRQAARPARARARSRANVALLARARAHACLEPSAVA